MLTFALLCGFAICIAACSDNDDEKVDERLVTEGGKTYVPENLLTEQEQYLLDCQSAIIRIMQQLAGLDEVTPDVVNHTYEPTYGMTLNGDGSHVRAAKCDTITAAEPMFLAIAGIDSVSATRLLSPTPDGYVLALKDLPIAPDRKKFSLGTLTFHRDAGPRRYGYVEVDIPCIPHLERIDYLSPDAFPDNASGNTAYQKGDIVNVTSSSGYCAGYYLCVKQYDGFDGFLVHLYDQGGSKAGVGGDETYNLDGDGAGAFLPYNKSKGQSTNFDIIKAYARFIVDEQDKVRNIKLFFNGEGTNKKPTLPGKLGHIFPGRFDNGSGRVWAPAGAPGCIWYDAIITDKYAWIPAYNYRRAYYAYVSSQKTADASVSDCSITYVTDSYWNDHWNDHSYNYCMNVIRFSTSEISGARLEFSPTKEILKTGIPAEEVTKSHLGWCYADDGFIYENASKAKSAGFTPLGIVAFVNDNDEQWKQQVTEKENGGGHALVLAYSSSHSTIRLNPSNNDLFTADKGYDQYIGETMQSALNDFGGWEKTQDLYYAGSPAAAYAIEYSPNAPGTGWFIPSAMQWMAILCSQGVGGAPWPSDESSITTPFGDDPKGNISKYGVNLSFSEWSSSARTTRIGLRMDFRSTPAWTWYSNWSGQGYVRPVFAY